MSGKISRKGFLTRLGFGSLVAALRPPVLEGLTASTGQGCEYRKHPREMGIGKRLRQLREGKGLSQGDIVDRPGLIRCGWIRPTEGATMAQGPVVLEAAQKRDEPLLCPSAQPKMKGCRVLGVVGGTIETPELAYLNQPVPVNEKVLRLAAPLKPTEVFRFAAHCEGKGCLHFDGANCRLATRIVQILPAVTEGLPACPIRPTCRWYQQEGKPACVRCPQIVTQTYEASEAYRRAAEGWDRSGPSDVRILLHAHLESP